MRLETALTQDDQSCAFTTRALSVVLGIPQTTLNDYFTAVFIWIDHISRTDWQTRLITSYATDETRALLGLTKVAETEPEVDNISQKAEYVIAASATMSQTEVDILEYLSKWKDELLTSQYFINEQKPKQKKFIRLSNVDEAIDKIRELVRQGKNVYVPTDSASQTEVYEIMTRLDAQLASARITAKTKGLYDLSEINATVEQYQVVFASPTLGTGVDINNSHFHAVVGIFKNAQDLTYMDCKQAVGRVRYPIDNEVYVYMDETYRWFETDPETLADRFDVRSNAVAPFISGMHLNEAQDAWEYERHQDYDFIQDQQVKYLAQQERGKVARGHKFWQAVQADGHEVVNSKLYTEQGNTSQVSGALKETAKAVKEANAHRVASSPVLSQEQVGELQKRAQQVRSKSKGALTEQEQNSLERYFISSAIY
ncbi:MAG: hypothetical protein KME49_27385, partial [Brasilonema octagenarum HA4186-MV1]|nr:hypothetical protein [Brasilonema octagenarum HA4186-MV1]